MRVPTASPPSAHNVREAVFRFITATALCAVLAYRCRHLLLAPSFWAEDGTIMGIRGPRLGIDGVQFHPEAVLTAAGHRLLANWLVTCGLEGALSAVPGTGAPLAVSAPHGGAHP